MGRFESARMLLSKQTGWPTFAQLHPSVKTVSDTKNNCYKISQPIEREKISDLCNSTGIAPQGRMDVRIQGHVL